MRLVVSNTTRRSSPQRPQGEDSASQPSSTESITDIVNLVSTENRRAVSTDVPTALEAEAALRDLQGQLPTLDSRQVGDIHSGLDRRVILYLLAPLMEV